MDRVLGDSYRFFWLLLGAGVFSLMAFEALAPLAVWAFGLFLLRFTRLSAPLAGFLWLSAVQAGVLYFLLDDVIPVSGPEYVITIVISGVFATLPFLADRYLAGRVSGWAATLVFPCASVFDSLCRLRHQSLRHMG